MRSLNETTINVVLKDQDGDEHRFELKPTFRAITAITNFFTTPNDTRGALQIARDRLAGQDIGAIAFIIRTGANLPDKQARDLPELIYQNGLDVDLIVPLIRYVAILANGGRPLPDDPDAAAEAEEKNY